MSCQGFPECSRGCGCDTPREWEGPVCFHCYAEIPDGAVFEAGPETFCSTLCAEAYHRGHGENCQRPECGDGAPATLPVQLCAYCDEPTGGPTAHPACRERVLNALMFQAGAGGVA